VTSCKKEIILITRAAFAIKAVANAAAQIILLVNTFFVFLT